MADLSDMKPTELTTLWCDLSRPNNIWSNQGVDEWRPRQNFMDLLLKIEETLVQKLNISIWEVRVMP